jgi:hypothetical protein
LEYPLEDGYVHNWLVAGPLTIPVQDTGELSESTPKIDIVRRHHQRTSDIHDPPVERGTFQIGDTQLTWCYHRCQDDHLVDLSATYPVPTYVRSWAYVQLESPADQELAWTLATNGLADVWLNRTHVHQHSQLIGQDAQETAFQGTLAQGTNEILVRFESAAVGDCPHLMALQLADAREIDVVVRLPVPHGNVYRRQKLERVFEHVHLEHQISLRGANVFFHWDDELEETDEVGHWLRDRDGIIRVYGQDFTKPGSSSRIGGGQLTLDQGRHQVAFLPPSHVIERYDIRYRRRLPFYALEHAYSHAYYGTYPERRQEALQHSARNESSLYGELARSALRQWRTLDKNAVQRAMGATDHRSVESLLDLMGLLVVLHRCPDRKALIPDIQQAIRASALGFDYKPQAIGHADRQPDESGAILRCACELLAGQAYPESTFVLSGRSGRWHRTRGEELALEWLHKRGTEGFDDWDSHVPFERMVAALAPLTDLAEHEQVRERAAIALDKLFFTIAVNSFRGVFGSTHRCAQAAMIDSGQLEATSGITRLLWGTGVWNQHIAGLVALAASSYELPTMIASIAVDLADEMWHKERHPDVHKVTYRTPDYMLCSAQDHRPGERGRAEHIWQATLGPDAIVFVNHPPVMSQADVHKPSFWAGNRVLPRVAQFKDVLVAIHSLEPNDRLGFCHAHWPVYEFDELALTELAKGAQWAFARKGEAYIALACSQELRLVKQGPAAFRELRAYGPEQVWVCMMGREALDGSFEAFQSRVRALTVEWQGLGVQCETLRGCTVSLSWTGPFLVDDQEQPLSHLHYDGPHCRAEWPATQMDIQYREYAVRLHLSE